MENNITTEAIAELVRFHGTIPAPDVGKHFGQPYWTGDIESAAKPLIESGQITISSEEGVVWNHNFKGNLYPTVPQELKALRQWVLWREKQRDGKPTKIPYQVSGVKAKADTPETWTDYQSAIEHRDRFSGVGFVFSEDDPYCGIDLDNCLANGTVKAWAAPITERLKPVSYGEVSPSGKGIKFWTRAVLPVGAKNRAWINQSDGEGIEAYDTGRYFTVTGKGKGTIGEGQAVIDWIVAQHLTPDQKPIPPPSRPLRSPNLATDEVIEKIRQSKQSAKFDALMAGNTTGYGSQSEADLALCAVTGFWTQDRAVIDAIFRQSELMRPKWDEKHRADGTTYGQMTIEKAISECREVYTPRKRTHSRNKRRYRSRTASAQRNL